MLSELFNTWLISHLFMKHTQCALVCWKLLQITLLCLPFSSGTRAVDSCVTSTIPMCGVNHYMTGVSLVMHDDDGNNNDDNKTGVYVCVSGCAVKLWLTSSV